MVEATAEPDAAAPEATPASSSTSSAAATAWPHLNIVSLAPPADDSSDDGLDEDGLPAVGGGFGYWSQMLNVTKVDDPLPPPPAKAEVVDADRPHRGKGGKGAPNAFGERRSEWRGKGKGKGYSGKGGGNYRPRAPPLNTKSVDDFFSWAKDPSASDGRQRENSRSPRRQEGARRLDSFMSWAKEEDEIATKQEPEDSGAAGLDSFLAWASEPKSEREVVKTEEDGKDRGEDALAEKEERRLHSDDDCSGEGAEGSSLKRSRRSTEGALLAQAVLPPLADTKAEEGGLPPPKKEAEEVETKEEDLGAAKAEKEDSDDDIDIAAMQRWKRLDDDDND